MTSTNLTILIRPFFALLIITSIGALQQVAHAQTTKTIDRTVRSEPLHYGITFTAEAPTDSSVLGHAFIIWQKEDDSKNMSTAEAIGFYPSGDPNLLQLIFGTPGAFDTDIGTPADFKLTVLVNSDLYQAALDSKSQWEQDGKYSLLWRNCTSHVANIAQALGLKTTNGNWQNPAAYLQDLMNNNN